MHFFGLGPAESSMPVSLLERCSNLTKFHAEFKEFFPAFRPFYTFTHLFTIIHDPMECHQSLRTYFDISTDRQREGLLQADPQFYKKASPFL